MEGRETFEALPGQAVDPHEAQDFAHAPATLATVGGHVTLLVSNVIEIAPNVRGGKLRALGVMDTKRNPALPNVPTALESGYPDLSSVIEWYGIVVPAATPREIVVRLNSDVHRALKSPDVLKRVTGLGQTPSAGTPEEFADLMRKEHERWGRVVKASGAKAD